jgi:hypothetical protein
MKDKHILMIVGGAIGAALAIEAFYKHPTHGRGLQALAAAIGLDALL